MADYLTLPAIAHRIGYKTHHTVYSLIDKKAFPAYQKGRKWYTNDDLILQWELQQAKQCRERLINRRLQRETAKQTQAAQDKIIDPGHDKD